MPDPGRTLELTREKENLAKADHHIVEGEMRVTRQLDLLATLRRDGHALAASEELLKTLEQTLQVWKDHREAIIGRIAYLENDRIGPIAGPASS